MIISECVAMNRMKRTQKKAIICCFVFYLDIFRRDEGKRAELGHRSWYFSRDSIRCLWNTNCLIPFVRLSNQKVNTV